MDHGKFFFASFLLSVLFVTIQSAADNSTAPGALAVNASSSTPAPQNLTASGNNNTNSTDSEESCEEDTEAPGKGSQRQGKELDLTDKEAYKHDQMNSTANSDMNSNSTSNSTSDASGAGGNTPAKLQSTNVNSTTKAGSSSSSAVWANVILATLISSFTYSTL